MLNNEFKNGMEYKKNESNSNRIDVYDTSIAIQLSNFKRFTKMAQIRALWILVDFFVGSFTIAGIVTNYDNFKAWVLFAASLTFLIIRGVVYVIQKKQAIKDKELDIWEKEQDKLDRIRKQNRFRN
jgi:magnesium-transporting ATPase (P-type)